MKPAYLPDTRSIDPIMIITADIWRSEALKQTN